MNKEYVKVKSRKYLNTHAFPHGINPEMFKYCEKVLRIREVFHGYYFLEGNEWIWDEDMVIKGETSKITIKNE